MAEHTITKLSFLHSFTSRHLNDFETASAKASSSVCCHVRCNIFSLHASVWGRAGRCLAVYDRPSAKRELVFTRTVISFSSSIRLVPGSNRFRSELEKSLCDDAGPGSEHIAALFLVCAARVSWPPSLRFFERVCRTRSQSTGLRVADRRISHVSIAARFTVVHTVSVLFFPLCSRALYMHARRRSLPPPPFVRSFVRSFVRLSLSRSVNHLARFASRTTTFTGPTLIGSVRGAPHRVTDFCGISCD
jgi:hypothetical protein